MKRCAPTFSMVWLVLCLGLIAGAPLLAQLPRAFMEPEDREREENNDMYWRGWLTPEQYRDAYEYITRRMPDERDGKHERSIARANGWVPIGSTRVRINNKVGWHGRIRCFKWWRNAATGTWESYLGASSGGLWFGDFAVVARAWISLGDNLPNPSVGAFEIHPTDRNTIFVGTGDWARYAGSGLYKTTDRGLSWTRIRLNQVWNEQTPAAITALFYGRTTDTMLLASDLGFFRSEDSGASWYRVNIVSTMPAAGVFNLVMDPTQPEILYAALPGFGIYKSTNSGASWREANNGIPTSNMGGTLALDISRTNPSVLYCAFPDRNGNNSSIYRSTNAGASWRPTEAPPDYMNNGQGFHTNALKVHPGDPNTVYAGSVGFVRSTDGGVTWSSRDSGHADLQFFDFLPSDPTYVYIGSDGGLFIHNDQTNETQNLAEYFTPYAPIQSYGMDYGWSATNVLVGGTQDNGTLLTERAFESQPTWRSIGGCDGANDINIDPGDPNLIYFNSWCGPHPRLRTTDMGRTAATNINNGLAELYYSPIKMNKGNTNYLFTVTSTGLYFSVDKGSSWKRATVNGAASTPTDDFTSIQLPRRISLNYGAGAPVTCYVWFWDNYPPRPRSDGTYLKIAEGDPGSMTWRTVRLPRNEVIKHVTPDRWNSAVAYAMTDNSPLRVYRTTDRGASWSDITGNLPNINTWDIAGSLTNPDLLYAATDLGVFKTRTAGAATGTVWYRYQYGLPIVGVNTFAYIPGAGRDTLRISTFGRGYWQRVLAGDDPIWTTFDSLRLPIRFLDVVSLRDISGASSGTALAVADSGILARTTNGGRTWDFTAGLIPGTLRGVAVSDCTTVIAVGDNASIIRSSDGGFKWEQIQVPAQVDLYGVCFVDSQTGFACGNEGVILKTETGGTEWSEIASAKGERLTKIVFTDPKNGWVIGDYDGQTPIMRRTTDGGATWIAENGLGVIVNALQFLDAQTAYAVGEGGSMFKTTDGGALWEPLKTGVQAPLYGCHFFNADSGWVCGAGGMVLKTSDGGDTWEEEPSDTDGNLHAIASVPEYLIMAADSVLLRRHLLPAPLAGVRGRAAATELELAQNTPNPFSTETRIGFTLPRATRAHVTIYNALGQLVTELPARDYPAGTYENVWDGTDMRGAPVPAGLYLYRMTTNEGSASRQMVVVR